MGMISMSILTRHVQVLHLYVSILAQVYPFNFPLLNIFQVISFAFRSHPKIDQFDKSKIDQFDKSKINDQFEKSKTDQLDNDQI